MIYKNDNPEFYSDYITSLNPFQHCGEHTMRGRQYKNKNIFIGQPRSDNRQPIALCTRRIMTNPNYILSYRTTSPAFIKPGCTIFVEKECLISRELLRNSGYKITINREKADVIVMPRFESPARYNFDAIARKGSSVILLSFKDDITSETCDLDELRQLFIYEGYTDVLFKSELISDGAYFIPKYDSYEELLEDGYSSTKLYIEENNIPIDYPNKISFETLCLWKNITDMDLMAKLLLGANVQDYPLTILFMLHQYWCSIHLSDNPKLKMIFKELHYNNWHRFKEDALTYYKPVTPEDWNMLQRIIVAHLNVTEKGGYVKEDNITIHMDNILQKRLAVKPFNIEAPMSTATIFNEIQTLNEY